MASSEGAETQLLPKSIITGYEEEVTVSNLAGRIKYCTSTWKEITNDPFILEVVEGYKIPFIRRGFQSNIPNHPKFSLNEQIACEKAINELLSKGAISPYSYDKNQFLSSYFLRQKPNKEYRFILNLRKLNKFIFTPHFKLEDLKIAIKLVK